MDLPPRSPLRFGPVARWGLALAAALASPGAAAEGDCLDQAMVVVYLHRLQDRVMEEWGIPVDSGTEDEVVVRMRVGLDGSLRSHEIVSTTSHRLAKTVEFALLQAAPFEPIPEEAACLARQKITMRFQNENPY